MFDASDADPEGIAETVRRAIEQADTIVDTLVGAPRTTAASLTPLDEISDLMARAWGRTGFLAYVHPDADVRDAARMADERLSKWAVDLAFRDDLYEAISEFAATPEAEDLDGELARLLEFTLRDLRHAGHELGPDRRRRLKEITSRLVELGIAFERNIADVDDRLTVGPDGLEGLPDAYVESLPVTDDGSKIVTMAYPHVLPFLENASRRDLRQELYRLFNNRAAEANRPILEEAVALRSEAARLFDQPSWAEHRLEDRMARSPERVEAFYEDLVPPLRDAGRRDVARMAEMLERDTGDTVLQAWDWRYYDTQLRKRDYGVDPIEVAEYFPLDRVLSGLFDITGEVFGLRYEPADLPSWHDEVVSYAIFDQDGAEPRAWFYMDLFPREGTFSHAAAFPIVPGRRRSDGSYQRPVSAIVANFTRATDTRPSLLLHSEVETFFHEFGHILHQTLTTADLVRFSGTSTERDFVEAPSQIMEHWVWQAEVLARFARHHETGQPIPRDMVQQLTAARQLNVALAKLRQIQFGVLDLSLHGPGQDKDIEALAQQSASVTPFPPVAGTFYPASFGHLMAGYDAGYYGYLWAEVFGDDMFSRFEHEGLTDAGVGADYRREILATGGTRDAVEHLRAFLGREPDNAAFLRKLGIS